MATVYVGAAGYFYEDWKGVFYPKGLPKDQWLKHYSKIFDFTEINNSFYNIPSEEAIHKWATDVPEKFRFAVKLWQKITHEVRDTEVESNLQYFFNRFRPLFPKIAAFLLQFPPWFKNKEEHRNHLKNILKNLPKAGKFILELRDNSWFEKNYLDTIIDGKRINLGTSYMDGVQPIFFPNQKNYYIRMIGNRELTVFNKTQREQTEIMADLLKEVRERLKTPTIQDIFVIFNNHFRGFSPSDVNEFKKMIGLPVKDYRMQHDLTEFMKKKMIN